jgi:Na+/H+ antiporter NhaD/arsenite permease-like protein
MHIILSAVIVVMFLIAAVIILRLWGEVKYRRRKASRGKEPPAAAVTRRVEFTKLILLLVMLAYFITVGLGIHLSLIDPMQFSTLAMLVGAPTATAIGFYAWKAKAENVLKLHKENKKETEGVPFDPGNIT